jgi:hypothetical protein
MSGWDDRARVAFTDGDRAMTHVAISGHEFAVTRKEDRSGKDYEFLTAAIAIATAA